MPSPAMTGNDVRRILYKCMDQLGERLQDRMSYLGDMATPTETIDMIAEELYRLPITIEFMLQATSTDQEKSEDKTPHATQLEKGVYTDVPPWE